MRDTSRGRGEEGTTTGVLCVYVCVCMCVCVCVCVCVWINDEVKNHKTNETFHFMETHNSKTNDLRYRIVSLVPRIPTL